MASKKKIRFGERIHLGNREAFSLPRLSQCLEIVCTDGVIWVTFHGDPGDYVLKNGDHLLTGKSRNAVISAIGASEFSLMQGDSARDLPKYAVLKKSKRISWQAKHDHVSYTAISQPFGHLRAAKTAFR